jgi:tetratricopeptide (TPR) repeat protein
VFPLLDDPILSVRLAAVPVVASVPRQLFTKDGWSAIEKSAREFRQAQMVSADRPGAHVNAGLLNLYLGNRDEARRDYEKAIEVGPYYIPAYVNLADLERLEQRDDRGERLLRQALQIVPESAEAHYALGLLLVRQQRTEEGVELFRRATEIDPTEPHYGYVYGIALNSTGHPRRALEVLETAHRKSPGNSDILVALATIHRDQGEIDSAIRYAGLLVQEHPNDPRLTGLQEELENMRTSRRPVP